MTKAELLKECEIALQASLESGKIAPTFFPSWTKAQLSQYLDAMKSENPLALKIAGTLHN